MASYKGNAGVISVAGSGSVANVKTFSIDVSAATVETTTMGVTAATHPQTGMVGVYTFTMSGRSGISFIESHFHFKVIICLKLNEFS